MAKQTHASKTSEAKNQENSNQEPLSNFEMPEKIKIKVKGSSIDNEIDQQNELFPLKCKINLRSKRSEEQKEFVFDGNEIGQLDFEDGTEWIGYMGDLLEIYNDETDTRASEADTYYLSNTLAESASSERGIVKTIFSIFGLSVFKPMIAKEVQGFIKYIDKKIVETPGLYSIDKNFKKTPFNSNQALKGSVLLLLHGVLSISESAFDGLKDNEELFGLYNHILVYDHHTLQKNPIENALEILKALPDSITIDILSHSRGGLVGDVLCRCSFKNSSIGFNNEEVKKLTENDEVQAEDLKELNNIALQKEIIINNFVRVACPAGGTTLLSKRLDHFLNILLNTFGAISGLKANPIYLIIKELLMEVVNCRTQAKDIPGLWAMTPDSSYQSVNNNREVNVVPNLYVVAGDAEGSWNILKNTGQTLAVILTNLFYQEANDFAVDTKSMKKGMSRANGLYQYISRSTQTNHFNYFSKDEKAKAAVLLALRQKTFNDQIRFEYISKDQMDRGVGLALTFNHYMVEQVSGERPIAILIPGIMGSTLQDSKNDIWVNLSRIAQGDMVNNLKIDDPDITPSGAIAKYYMDMGKFLQEKNDLRVFAFDWRKSLKDAASSLKEVIELYLKYNQPITIVAHSMGGLVAKHLMFLYPDLWNQFKEGLQNKLILLGTPWKGSHLIMEVLTGHSSRLKLLGRMDLPHLMSTLLKEVARYPGVLELLPLDTSGFTDESLKNELPIAQFKGYDDKAFWDAIRKYAPLAVQVDQGFQTTIKNFINRVNGEGIKYSEFTLSEDDKKKVFYIAGQDDTVFGCKIKNGFFKGKHLVYLSTPKGDGSVTWDLGIPKELPTEQVFYSRINHTDLSNDKLIFNAVSDIIEKGTTDKLPHEAPEVRSGMAIKEISQIDSIAADDNELMDLMFGTKPKTAKNLPLLEPLQVSVLNGDLKYSNFPIMLGHFKGDNLFSAEKALDNYLKGKLSERHRLGYYPNEIIESEITYQASGQPKGALIIGLGRQNDLTAYRLALSVERAVIKYAFFFRDNYELAKNKQYAKGISAILIGSSFGGLPVENCVQAIISGVQKANDCIVGIQKGLEPIRFLEFVDYYEDKAQQCYLSLKKLESDYNQNNIKVLKFESGIGNMKRIVLNDNASWWHTISTATQYLDEKETNPIGLLHNMSDGKARVEQSNVCSDLKVASFLTEQFSESARWDYKLSKTLFELLIPNNFKSVLKNQNNIIWKMDEYAAQFPWEMFHDYIDDRNMQNQIPTFVNTGFIRQFITDHYRVQPTMVDQRKALVVGEPDYSNTQFVSLPGAAQEARLVSQIISSNRYDVQTLIHERASNIIKELFSDAYRIVHFAAHGIYEKIVEDGNERIRAGVVLGDGLFLEPCTLNQLSAIPEFIFINCCYSGTIVPSDEKYYKHRPHLAANIGTQLIEMGVKAIVITGWAVDDVAANTFAEAFYNYMFEGYEFGQSVKLARRKCYEKHANTNTWGAYQCYGDPYFKLSNKSPNQKVEEVYVTPSQAIVDLENMISILKGQKLNVNKQLEHLEQIKKRVNNAQLENSAILEHYALVYGELGEFEPAVSLFEQLLKTEKANFSVTSIEQYLDLNSRLLLVKSINDKSNSGNLIVESKGIIAKLELLNSLGKTSERLNILGGMHRRASLISNSPEEKEEHLERMYLYFRQAYDLFEDRKMEVLAYPLSNFILANWFCKTNKENLDTLAIADFKTEGQSLIEALKAAINSMNEKGITNKTFFAASAQAKLYSCLYILDTDNEINFNQFKSILLAALNNYGNIKNIKGQQELIWFLCNQFGKNTGKYKKLIALYGELKQMLQELNK
ncbi:MAG TPA: CHAT domain-containing protein [Edaphocola sp.]|nr:CHAT domain-containing protein [Edaphocola sp.]